MFSLTSQLISRRILYSIRFNCINKTFQTNVNKLQKRVNSETINGFVDKKRFQRVVNQLETSLTTIGKISFNQINECIQVLSKCKQILIKYLINY